MPVLKGILLLARFRAEGLACFTATPAAFMNSLAPMMGISLVAGLPALVSGELRLFALHVLTSAIALLCPPVISQLLAGAWRREAAWLRYAVAYNWCQTAVTLATMVVVFGFIAGGGQGTLAGMMAAIVTLLLYWLAVGWFLARRGLNLSGGKAALAVLAINAGTGLAVLGPQLASMGWTGASLPGSGAS
jgi:hypothetical protein